MPVTTTIVIRFIITITIMESQIGFILGFNDCYLKISLLECQQYLIVIATIIKVTKLIIKLFINFMVLAINFVLVHLIIVVDWIGFEYGSWKFVKRGWLSASVIFIQNNIVFVSCFIIFSHFHCSFILFFIVQILINLFLHYLMELGTIFIEFTFY